ncbi:MAG TPA: hypothetical protein VHN18_10725 [Micromonosporaceae bacterium]|nr:hypothetical protein [Micromonosporaceae bacterium]
MSQQQRTTGQERDEAKEKQERERAAEGTFGDRAAQARTADDPRVQAPRDRAGMPSTGDEQL